MGDVGDHFRDLRKSRQAKRAERSAAAVSALGAAGVSFRELNGAGHLRIALPDGRTVDYWPGPGRLLDGGPKTRAATLADVLRAAGVRS